jgi:hypothetical protein
MRGLHWERRYLLWQSRYRTSLAILQHLFHALWEEDLEVDKNAPNTSARLKNRQARHIEQTWTLTPSCGVEDPHCAKYEPSEHVQGQSVACSPCWCLCKRCDSSFNPLSWLSVLDLGQKN